MRAVREHLSGKRDHARAAPVAHRAGEAGGRSQRSRAVQLRALRQALRHAPDGGQHAREAHRPLDVRGRGLAETAADVRRLPRGGHDAKQGRDFDTGRQEMSSTVTPLRFHAALVQEDEARAGYYALLGRLFYAGPDAGSLQIIAGSAEIAAAGGQLAGPWNALVAAASATDAEAARLEYDELFVGTGKAEVTPYASFYLAATGREKILVRLKQDLVALGLVKAGAAREPEDHFAGLFE